MYVLSAIIGQYSDARHHVLGVYTTAERAKMCALGVFNIRFPRSPYVVDTECKWGRGDWLNVDDGEWYLHCVERDSRYPNHMSLCITECQVDAGGE